MGAPVLARAGTASARLGLGGGWPWRGVLAVLVLCRAPTQIAEAAGGGCAGGRLKAQPAHSNQQQHQYQYQ